MKLSPYGERRTITLGELCEALADNRVDSRLSDGYYIVSQRDLLNYAGGRHVSELLLLLERRSQQALVRAS